MAYLIYTLKVRCLKAFYDVFKVYITWISLKCFVLVTFADHLYLLYFLFISKWTKEIAMASIQEDYNSTDSSLHGHSRLSTMLLALNYLCNKSADLAYMHMCMVLCNCMQSHSCSTYKHHVLELLDPVHNTVHNSTQYLNEERACKRYQIARLEIAQSAQSRARGGV